jgi:single-strand DNA-binding protein
MDMSETYLAVQGWVGTDIRLREVSEGVSVASFRVAATPQQYNASTASWSDRPTNWFTVECWRALAANVSQSMKRGQPVVVTGRFRTTEWRDDAGNPRSSTVIEATAVGHDLSKGVATFTRSDTRSQFPTSTEGSSLRRSDEAPGLASAATDEEDLPETPIEQAA